MLKSWIKMALSYKEGVTTIGTRAFGGSVLRNSAYEFQEAQLILSEGVTRMKSMLLKTYLNQLKMPRASGV